MWLNQKQLITPVAPRKDFFCKINSIPPPLKNQHTDELSKAFLDTLRIEVHAQKADYQEMYQDDQAVLNHH